MSEVLIRETVCARRLLYNGAYVKYPYTRYRRTERDTHRTSVKTHRDGALWSESAIKSAAKPLVKLGKNSPNKVREARRRRYYLHVRPPRDYQPSPPLIPSSATVDSAPARARRREERLDLHYFPAFHETLTHHPRRPQPATASCVKDPDTILIHKAACLAS